MSTTNPSDTSKTTGDNKQNASGTVKKATEPNDTATEKVQSASGTEKATEPAGTATGKAQNKVTLTPPPEPRKADAKAFATDFLM
ncbi:hypothetical protein BGZ92_005145, partial [Podila epicladia]